MPPPPKETVSCEMYSNRYFILCGVGGALACGSTHILVTPLDLVKCRLQVDPRKYKSIYNGFVISFREGGYRNLLKGWAPTLLGYSVQGSIRFSLYEYFKYRFANAAGEDNAYIYRNVLYLAASASAEFVADFFLAPFEATKVRMQTTPGYTSQMRRAIPHMFHLEGMNAFFKGLPPLWGRQVPYTMMKFSSFEAIIEYIYANLVPKKREECSKVEQLIVTFTAGYIAGVLCAIVSHPSDTIVSKLNKDPTVSVGGIISELGFSGVWSGLEARIIMIGTIAALQWLIYDGFKVFAKMPRPPPPVPPPNVKKQMEIEAKEKENAQKEVQKKK